MLTSAITTTIFFVWFGSGAYSDLGGLVQRALVLSAYGLPVIVGWAARVPTTPVDLCRFEPPEGFGPRAVLCVRTILT